MSKTNCCLKLILYKELKLAKKFSLKFVFQKNFVKKTILSSIESQPKKAVVVVVGVVVVVVFAVIIIVGKKT